MKSSLKAKQIDDAIVPVGCTKYIQLADVCLNKPIKDYATVRYDEWLATEGIHTFTEAGNLQAPPRKAIVQWVLAAWDQVSKESVIKAFRCCALSLPNDGLKDDEIHCF